MESYFPPSLDLGHFEHKPRELPPGAVHPVVVGELREHRHNEDGEDEAQQPQEELLDLAVRLRGTQDLLIEHHDLECKGNGITGLNRICDNNGANSFICECETESVHTGLSLTSKSDSGPQVISLLSPILLMRFYECNH